MFGRVSVKARFASKKNFREIDFSICTNFKVGRFKKYIFYPFLIKWCRLLSWKYFLRLDWQIFIDTGKQKYCQNGPA